MAENITREDVVEKLRKASWVMLTTATTDGKLVSHPMVPQETTEDADVWFVISRVGDQADAIRGGSQVNLAIAEAGTWLSVSGTVKFVEDRAKVDELWNESLKAWFTGRNDPNVALVKVTSQSAQFWGTPGGKVQALARVVKNRVTGDRPGGGSQTMEL